MTYTLVADGSSDAVLLPILDWCLRQRGVAQIQNQWADRLRLPRAATLRERLGPILELYPCDVLFIHRDAETQSPADRRHEISGALHGRPNIRHIPVIPIRMTEAWLLADEAAIRRAAGNPNGTEPLNLPPLSRVESLPDPKTVLHEALRNASGLNSRRRAAFPATERARRVVDYIDDFSPLTALSAFKGLQQDIASLLFQG